MKLNVKATQFSLTPSVEEYINEKLIRTVERLTKRMDPESIRLNIEVAKTTKHHQKGEVWRADATLRLGGKSMRSEASGESIQEAIDLLEESLGMEIKGFKGKEEAVEKRQARKLKRATKFSKAARPRRKTARVRNEGM
jgi:ribosomal subunit interface protein